VVLKLVGPITGPDGSSVDIGEARLIAAAVGSETDGRALFRLTSLAMRAKDGRRIVLRVDGWVVGEDGIRGMKGKLIDKLGKLIAATGTVGFTAALGESLMANNSLSNDNGNSDGGITVVSGDLNYAAANALSEASSKLNEVLIDRYEKLVPVVEILSGREAAIVFSQATEIQLIDEDESDEGMYRTAALD
jgi:conjugal transfer pilus assembly protein TraB